MADVSPLFPKAEDFNGLKFAEAKQIYDEMMQDLHNRHQLYNKAASQIAGIKSSITFRKALNVFSAEFADWQKNDYKKGLSTQNQSGTFGLEMLPVLDRVKPIFQRMDDVYQETREQHLTDLLIPGVVDKFESALTAINDVMTGLNTAQSTIEENTVALRVSVQDTLKTEVDALKNIKRDLNLNQSFGELVEAHATSLPATTKSYFRYFVVVIFLLAAALALPSYFAHREGWEWYTEVLMRFSLGLPLAWLALLLYNHVRMYRASQLRYQHLDRMLKGGLTAALDFIEPTETEVRREAYRKYIDLYLDITNDAAALYAKNPVTEDALKKALALVKEATGAAQAAKSIVEPPKPAAPK